MKSIIFTVIVLVVFAAGFADYAHGASTCTPLKCAAKDGPCGTDKATIVCRPGEQYCNGTKCTDQLKEGQACAADGPNDQCGELSCQLVGGAYSCAPIVYRVDPGEACTTDSQCYYKSIAAQTSNSTCVHGKCYGNHLGDSCEGYGQCVGGLFCSTTGTCTALKVNSVECSARSECISGSCVPSNTTSTTSTCVPFQSVAENGACDVTEDCVAGHYCSYATNTEWGVCTSAVASSNTACASDGDCVYPESCVCNTASGTSKCVAPHVRPVALAMAEYNYSMCMMQSKCNTSQCTLDMCSKELCAYNSILYGPSVWNSNIVNLACVYGEAATAAFTKCNSELATDESSQAGHIISDSSDALILLPAFVVVGCAAVAVLAF